MATSVAVVKLTPELIHAGRSASGGWNRKQLETIGIPWCDLTTGWISRHSGREVSSDSYQRFLSLKGITKKVENKKTTRDDYRAKNTRTSESERIALLESLVVHCWVHSSYKDCGYAQIDSAMKELYLEVIRLSAGK